MTNQSNGQEPARSLFRELVDETVIRTKKPLKHPSFIFYFLGAILGFSGLGVWLELYAYIYAIPDPWPAEPSDALRTAVLTFFPAVGGAAAMQLIWAEPTKKHYRSAAFTIGLLLFLVALLVFPSHVTNASALFVGILASLFSMWLWWIANATQTDLLDTVDPAAAVGGDDTAGKLPGSLDKYQH